MSATNQTHAMLVDHSKKTLLLIVNKFVRIRTSIAWTWTWTWTTTHIKAQAPTQPVHSKNRICGRKITIKPKVTRKSEYSSWNAFSCWRKIVHTTFIWRPHTKRKSVVGSRHFESFRLLGVLCTNAGLTSHKWFWYVTHKKLSLFLVYSTFYSDIISLKLCQNRFYGLEL